MAHVAGQDTGYILRVSRDGRDKALDHHRDRILQIRAHGKPDQVIKDLTVTTEALKGYPAFRGWSWSKTSRPWDCPSPLNRSSVDVCRLPSF